MKLDDDWRKFAACKGVIETEQFYGKGADSRNAKNFCKRCPVQPDCLEYALLTEQYGIWGGMSETERDKRYPLYIREAMREDFED